jgi:hypothetical protein
MTGIEGNTVRYCTEHARENEAGALEYSMSLKLSQNPKE